MLYVCSFGVPAGLLAPGNKNYSDVTLCCGGTLDFSWMVTPFVPLHLVSLPLLLHSCIVQLVAGCCACMYN
jgi:hypothetical protein